MKAKTKHQKVITNGKKNSTNCIGNWNVSIVARRLLLVS